MDYFGARYYNNSLARFTAVDPLVLDPRSLTPFLSDPQRLNSYSYAGGNPIVNTDPDGKCFGPFIAACAALLLVASNPGIVEAAWDTFSAVLSGAYFLNDPSPENSAYLAQDLGALYVTGAIASGGLRRVPSLDPEPIHNQQVSKFSKQADVVRLRHIEENRFTEIQRNGFSEKRRIYTLNLDDPTSNYVSSDYYRRFSESGNDFGMIDINLPKTEYDKLRNQGLVEFNTKPGPNNTYYDEVVFKPGAAQIINKYLENK